MKRVLDFEGPRGHRRFELLLTALMAGGDASSKPEGRTPASIRKEARLIEAFEAISEPLPAAIAGTDPSARALLSGNGDGPPTLLLAQEDFDLLQQYTEKTAWMPRVSRDVVDCWDWLSAAPKVE